MTEDEQKIGIVFILPCGTEKHCEAYIGENILTVSKNNDIPIEGSCSGSCACATCHVVLEDEHFDSLGQISEDEEDMLDMAFDLERTSRLGCQVYLEKSMDGMRIKVPKSEI